MLRAETSPEAAAEPAKAGALDGRQAAERGAEAGYLESLMA